MALYISYIKFIANEFVIFNILHVYVPFPTQKLAAQITRERSSKKKENEKNVREEDIYRGEKIVVVEVSNV